MELKEGKYQIQGVRLVELCEEYGAPLYVYDFSKIDAGHLELEKRDFDLKKLFS